MCFHYGLFFLFMHKSIPDPHSFHPFIYCHSHVPLSSFLWFKSVLSFNLGMDLLSIWGYSLVCHICKNYSWTIIKHEPLKLKHRQTLAFLESSTVNQIAYNLITTNSKHTMVWKLSDYNCCCHAFCMPQPENMYMNHNGNKYLCIYELKWRMLEFFFPLFIAFSLK